MRQILIALVFGLLLPGGLLGAACPKDKSSGSGIVPLALDADVNKGDTISLRWETEFFDAIFKSPRYCFVPNIADAYVIVGVQATDTNPRDFMRTDRAAVSVVATFAADTRFLMHQLQICSPEGVDSCAARTLTQLDNELTKHPDEPALGLKDAFPVNQAGAQVNSNNGYGRDDWQ